MPNDAIQKIAFVGDYVPRMCGIATFTHDLRTAVANQYPQCESIIVPVSDKKYKYPEEVRFEIDEQDISSYQRASDFINFNNIDVVSLQHEFGIFGGHSGSYILALLRDLKMPVVTTLHTILNEPTHEQMKIMKELIKYSARLVTMSEKGKDFLISIYRADENKIDVIPHGIPDMPFVDPNFYKDQFGVEGKYVLLTFGLLSPQKGIENVLKALPDVLNEFPNLVYIILGSTHPKLLKEQGESYRITLERIASDLGIKKSVIFYNRFVDIEELKTFIGAADIYITPYLSRAQITSGTLSYSLGCGKAVISTPYWHAEELLSDGRGVLVPFGDPKAIAKELITLLQDEPMRHVMRKKAYMLGRGMVWNNVAHLYMECFQKARLTRSERIPRTFTVKTLEETREELPKIRLDHLIRMSDSTGLLHHAKGSIPNFSEGYCTDDNARALILTIYLEEVYKDLDLVQSLASNYASFINYAFNTELKRFRNFMSYDRKWLEEVGSDDSHGRAIWALGVCAGRSRYKKFQIWSVQLFNEALPELIKLSSPRAWAFGILGIHEYFKRLSGDRFAAQVKETLTENLMVLFKKNISDDWYWCENIVSYDNAVIPHSLIISGWSMQNKDVYQMGINALKWLLDIQLKEKGYFRPIGSNGFYKRNETKNNYDQQPLEAYSTVSACLDVYRISKDEFWLNSAKKVFEWFLGRNDLGLSLYDTQTYGCHDALHVDRLNLNQGAESTLAFLLALTEIHIMETDIRSFQVPDDSTISISHQ